MGRPPLRLAALKGDRRLRSSRPTKTATPFTNWSTFCSAEVVQIYSALDILSTAFALGCFQVATGVLLLLGAVGWRARVSMPLAALSTLVYVGIFWHYTYFFHQCLIGIYVLVAVSLAPCADAWSFDCAARRTTLKSTDVYGWSRYLCWIVVALPYFLAGLSKLRGAGLSWWWPDNLRGKIFRDTLSDGLLNWDLGLLLVDAPDAIFAAIGLFTLSLELCFVSVLFSRAARQVLPLLVMGSIWAFFCCKTSFSLTPCLCS